MTTTAIRHALAVGLAAVLSAVSNPRAEFGPPGNGHIELAQYCAPIEEASADSHRFYCRSRHGWESDKPLPASDSPT
jgi:hypothetical protein